VYLSRRKSVGNPGITTSIFELGRIGESRGGVTNCSAGREPGNCTVIVEFSSCAWLFEAIRLLGCDFDLCCVGDFGFCFGEGLVGGRIGFGVVGYVNSTAVLSKII
jgi:hypothetical protein